LFGFIKKHFLIFVLTLIGLLIGLILFFSQESTKMYRVIYEYSKENQLPESTQVDTLFYVKLTLVRNFASSYADTLPELKRSELKIYSQKDLNEKEINTIISSVSNNKASLNSFRKDREGRSILLLISYSILGLFVGAILHLWKKNRTPQERKQ